MFIMTKIFITTISFTDTDLDKKRSAARLLHRALKESDYIVWMNTLSHGCVISTT